ncbi:MAG: VOC family protein [Planctomycetes bacterium]|nr:VOC family protein [Planctomycetota bacterium]
MQPHSTAVKALGEVALRVNDLERMQHFYEKVIGLEVMSRFPKTVFFHIAEGYGGHTQVLALFDRSGESRGPRVTRPTPQGVSQDRSTLDHLAFEIDLSAFESEKHRLEQHGLVVETAVFEWTGWRSLYVSDPEGNTVEFVCFDESIRP